jgi:hypothetical protein
MGLGQHQPVRMLQLGAADLGERVLDLYEPFRGPGVYAGAGQRGVHQSGAARSGEWTALSAGDGTGRIDDNLTNYYEQARSYLV